MPQHAALWLHGHELHADESLLHEDLPALDLTLINYRVLSAQVMTTHKSRLLIFEDKEKFKFYTNMDWSKTICELSATHKLSREWLTQVRRQVQFYNAFKDRKNLSFKEAKAVLNNGSKDGRVKGLKRHGEYSFARLCKAMKIEMVK